jgi:hypothetical protein
MKQDVSEMGNCMGDFGWDGKRKETVVLLNKLLENIPVDFWPKDFDSHKGIRYNSWTLDLMWVDGKRSADLRHKNNNHTAWVIEHRTRKGYFKDFDIGGS